MPRLSGGRVPAVSEDQPGFLGVKEEKEESESKGGQSL